MANNSSLGETTQHDRPQTPPTAQPHSDTVILTPNANTQTPNMDNQVTSTKTQNENSGHQIPPLPNIQTKTKTPTLIPVGESSDLCPFPLGDTYDPFAHFLTNFRLDDFDVEAVDNNLDHLEGEALMSPLHAGNVFAHTFNPRRAAVSQEQKVANKALETAERVKQPERKIPDLEKEFFVEKTLCAQEVEKLKAKLTEEEAQRI